jgi:hypothetical protein
VFDIDWNHIWRNPSERLVPYRIGYRVKWKGSLKGGRESSGIWKHGADLEYLELDNKTSRIWLCRVCHLQKVRSDAKTYNSTHYIAKHLLKAHHVSSSGDLIADAPMLPASPWMLARDIARATRALSQLLYNEGPLQAALIDWTILHDLSFRDATSSATRALISWNRIVLLAALPSAPTTLYVYILRSLEERKMEIRTLLKSARSKLSVSVDIWSSGNHLSFMAIVGHFVGE